MVRLVRLLPPHGRSELIRLARAGLARTFRTRRGWLVAMLGAVGCAFAYLLLARALVIAPEAEFARFGAVPSLRLATDLGPRYLWDAYRPPAILVLSDAVALAPPVPIALAAVAVGALFGANLAVAVETLARRATQCARASAFGLIATLPSFLASFSCCAPTVLLVVGANFAVAVVAVVPYVVPLAVLLLVGGVAWSAGRLERIARGELAPLT